VTVLRKSVFVILTLILAWHVFGIAGGFVAVCFPNIFKRYRTYYPNLVTKIPHESVVFRSRSGVPLNAFLFRNPNTSKAILLCHGRSYNKSHEMPYARDFMAHYNVLAIDFRSHGSNRSGTTTIGMKESQDVLGALDWLAEQGMPEVAVMGHSMGAAAAIKALSELEPNGLLQVKALVTEGAFADLHDLLSRQAKRYFVPLTISGPSFKLAECVAGYRIRDNAPERLIGTIRCPVLILQADNDYLCSPDCAERLFAAANKPKILRYFKGRHDTPCDEVSRLAMEFIDAHLWSLPTGK